MLCGVLFALAFSVVARADSPADLLSSGHVDEAIQTLQQKLTNSPDDATSQNLLCRAYFMLDEWDRGIAACERAVSLDPGNALYHLWLGRIYGEKADRGGFLTAAGLAKKVRTEFERAVELDPANVAARTDLAEFYLEAPGIVGGGKDKARAQAEALAHLDPATAHWVTGRLAERAKDEALAEREYRAAIDASQGGAHAWLNLAIFYRHTNHLDQMEQALITMETRPLDRPESLMDGASMVLRTSRSVPLGIRFLRRYLHSPVEQGPAFKAHYILGQLLEKQGDRPAAAVEFRAALALAHSYAPAKEALHRVAR
ncbi:MAG TPA: tetratricopeptide repeat protein [Candidatus Sulfotelmatobacter sp.]|nr:tetratricopeptide repeat protein [Candidatus Sulfotelmatobacter sp.]